MWRTFEDGATVSRPGPEGGVIVRDEEHASGARITLERDCSHAPWAVTYGIYGWFFHTRLVSSEAEAEFTAMLDALAAIIDIIPRVDDLDADAKAAAVKERIHEFVSCFP